MAEVDVNYMAVLAATLVSFVVGYVWYRPLFGKPWAISVGIDPGVLKGPLTGQMRRVLMVSFILQYTMAFCLAMFIGNEQSIRMATLYGFLAGLFWIAFAVVINAMYEQKSFKYMLINGGYWTITFTLMGLIIGAWQ